MSKDEMIDWLLRDIESDRFRAERLVGADSAQLEQSIKAEWSRLNAQSYGEIEALYFKSEGLYEMAD